MPQLNEYSWLNSILSTLMMFSLILYFISYGSVLKINSFPSFPSFKFCLII